MRIRELIQRLIEDGDLDSDVIVKDRDGKTASIESISVGVASIMATYLILNEELR